MSTAGIHTHTRTRRRTHTHTHTHTRSVRTVFRYFVRQSSVVDRVLMTVKPAYTRTSRYRPELSRFCRILYNYFVMKHYFTLSVEFRYLWITLFVWSVLIVSISLPWLRLTIILHSLACRRNRDFPRVCVLGGTCLVLPDNVWIKIMKTISIWLDCKYLSVL